MVAASSAGAISVVVEAQHVARVQQLAAPRDDREADGHLPTHEFLQFASRRLEEAAVARGGERAARRQRTRHGLHGGGGRVHDGKLHARRLAAPRRLHCRRRRHRHVELSDGNARAAAAGDRRSDGGSEAQAARPRAPPPASSWRPPAHAPQCRRRSGSVATARASAGAPPAPPLPH